MPIAASILWKPIDGPADEDAELPIFITQRALAAVHDHCATTRETCFGSHRQPVSLTRHERALRRRGVDHPPPGRSRRRRTAALMQGGRGAGLVHRTATNWSLVPRSLVRRDGSRRGAETHTALFDQPCRSLWWWAATPPWRVLRRSATNAGRKSACLL